MLTLTTQLLLILISATIFYSYVLTIFFKFGVLPDISSSYYKSGGKPYFTFFSFGISIPIIIVGVELSPLFFFAGALMSFMGVAAAFKDNKLVRRVHNVGAVGGITLAWLGLFFIGQYVIGIVMFLGIVGLFKYSGENRVWWVEIWAYDMIILGLILSVI